MPGSGDFPVACETMSASTSKLSHITTDSCKNKVPFKDVVNIHKSPHWKDDQ